MIQRVIGSVENLGFDRPIKIEGILESISALHTRDGTPYASIAWVLLTTVKLEVGGFKFNKAFSYINPIEIKKAEKLFNILGSNIIREDADINLLGWCDALFDKRVLGKAVKLLIKLIDHPKVGLVIYVYDYE